MPYRAAPGHIPLTRQHARHAMAAIRMVMHLDEQLHPGPRRLADLAHLASWDDAGAAIGEAIARYKRGETDSVAVTVPHAASAAMALQTLDLMGLHGDERTPTGQPVMAEAAQYLHDQLDGLDPATTVRRGRFRHPDTGVPHTYSTSPYWPVYETASPYEPGPQQDRPDWRPPPTYELCPLPPTRDGMLDLPPRSIAGGGWCAPDPTDPALQPGHDPAPPMDAEMLDLPSLAPPPDTDSDEKRAP